MAHIEPATWANSPAGGTRQFLKPLRSISWVWVGGPDSRDGRVVWATQPYCRASSVCLSRATVR
eukprot:7842176-Pyramimonas_sp.AAC.1